MAGEGDGSNYRHDQDLPDDRLEVDASLDAALIAENQPAPIASIQRFPPTSDEIAQRFRASLQQLVSDAAKHGVSLSTTEGLTSPCQMDIPDQQQGRLHSVVVRPTPDAPLKNSRTSAEQPGVLEERAQDDREPRTERHPHRRYHSGQAEFDTGRFGQFGREDHRRDRSPSSEDSDQYAHRKRQRGTIRLHGLIHKPQKQKLENQGQRLVVNQSFDTMGEPEGDRDILIQSLTREVQNNRRQINAVVRRYGRNELSDDELGSPFANEVLRMPFPERFRMPHVEQFKKDTDPKEHVRRYKSAMAQYANNDALLCLNFPQTLGDLGSRWFGRLPAASINSFNVSKAFSQQFIGNVHRKKSVAYLSQLKQGKDESLKKYLGRFGQAVSEIGSDNDEAIVAAFINNLQNGQLSFDLRRARLTSYADMIDMAGGYA